jgi:hypothetical protein
VLLAVSPHVTLADCDQPGLAAPAVAEFSLVAANEYFAAGLGPEATDDHKKAAADHAITRAQANFMGTVTDTVADAVAQSADPQLEESVATARAIAEHMNEVARTDKQVGASASVSGSTSAASKTGIAHILSMAVENGAVQREDNGTSATFSTSPYALVLLGKVDTDTTFNEYRHLRRVGIAATLDLDQGDSTGSGDFKAEQVSAVSTSVRLLGDRSARTTEFTTAWHERVGKPLTAHAEAAVRRDVEVLRKSPAILQIVIRQLASGPNEGELRRALRDALLSKPTQPEAVDAVAQTLQTQLCALVVGPILSGAIDVSGFDREALVASAASSIMSHDAALDEQQGLLN